MCARPSSCGSNICFRPGGKKTCATIILLLHVSIFAQCTHDDNEEQYISARSSVYLSSPPGDGSNIFFFLSAHSLISTIAFFSVSDSVLLQSFIMTNNNSRKVRVTTPITPKSTKKESSNLRMKEKSSVLKIDFK